MEEKWNWCLLGARLLHVLSSHIIDPFSQNALDCRRWKEKARFILASTRSPFHFIHLIFPSLRWFFYFRPSQINFYSMCTQVGHWSIVEAQSSSLPSSSISPSTITAENRSFTCVFARARTRLPQRFIVLIFSHIALSPRFMNVNTRAAPI